MDVKRAWSRILAPAFCIAAACIVATGAAGCRPQEQGRRFAVSFQVMNNPFFVDLEAGLREVIEAHGDRLVTLDAQFKPDKQRNDLADVIQQDVALIFVNPVNSEAISASLRQAKQKNIPCIIVDAPAKDTDLVACTVASDNVAAGRLAGEALAKVRRPAKIVILHHSVNKACTDRVAGFREAIAKYPDMEILDTQEGKGNTEGGRQVMQDMLRHPVNAVFAINDPSALGAVSALEAAGKLKDVTVVTVDGSREAAAAIKAGKLHGSSAQFPREIGRKAAEKAYDYLAGKPVEKDVVVRVELVTKDNADAFLK